MRANGQSKPVIFLTGNGLRHYPAGTLHLPFVKPLLRDD